MAVDAIVIGTTSATSLTVQVVLVLRGVGFADHSPDGPQTSKQPLQEAPASSRRLALQPGVAHLTSDRAAVRLLSLALCPSGSPIVFVELQDAVGEVLLLFVARRLVVPGGLAVSSCGPGLDVAPGFYRQNIAKDTLGRGQVHFRRAGSFYIETPKRRRIREWAVKAGEGRRGGTRFMNERHEGLQSSEQLEKRPNRQKKNINHSKRFKQILNLDNQGMYEFSPI